MKAHAALPADADAVARIVLRPNCSLSRANARRFIAGLALADLVLAALCVAHGAWPVVPYLLFQLVLLSGVVWVLRRHAAVDREVITLDETRLHIERRAGRRTEAFEFPRYWARVSLRPVRDGWHPSRLLVWSHGREVEIGATLLEAQRRQLAHRLKQAVGPDYRATATPALAVDAFDISRFNTSSGEMHGSR